LKQPQIPVVFLTECKTRKYPLAIDIRNQSACDAVTFSKSQNFAVSATVNIGGSGGRGWEKGGKWTCRTILVVGIIHIVLKYSRPMSK